MTGLQPWPPELPIVSGDNIDEAKAQLLELEAERDRLVAADQRSRVGLRPDFEARLRWVRDTAKTVRAQVQVIEKLRGAA
jgi:hypothetical protein